MSKLGVDQFPSYPAAGLKIQTLNESTGICLQSDYKPPHTPEHIKKYRKSYKEQYGTVIKHYGLINDVKPDEKFTYGIPTEKSQGAGRIMKAGLKEGVGSFVNQLQEQKYISLKREPLGQTINRNYKMPEESEEKGFKFGLATEKNQYDVKETIYSAQNMPQKQNIRLMYLKSHLDYDPGQQKKRPYNWHVDPDDFRFGKVAKNIIHNEMKQVISPQFFNDSFPKTKLIENNLNDYLNKRDDKLGKSSNLGQKQFPPEHAFGMKIQENQWGAGKCLRGEATEYDVRDDDDLGRCNKINCTNMPKVGDENRIFGIPTIRYDIKCPEKPSIADPQNYCDQTTAIQLLFPQKLASAGLQQSDFDVPRSKEEIKEIFENIGIRLKENIFEAVFERAKGVEGTILDRVSCSSFKKALQEMCV